MKWFSQGKTFLVLMVCCSMLIACNTNQAVSSLETVQSLNNANKTTVPLYTIRRTGDIKSISHTKSYGLRSDTSIVRAGKVSQRFEIRHGDCGGDREWSDCNNDRRRIERLVNLQRYQVVNKTLWFGYSLYLPSDFQQVSPANTVLGQLKLVGYRQPIWDLNYRKGLRFNANASGQACKLLAPSDIRGRWLDIVIGFDMTMTAGSGAGEFQGSYATVYINGTKTDCVMREPVFTRKMLTSRTKSSDSFHFDYGIYNSYVSRWLDANRARNPGVAAFTDTHQDSGLVVQSAARDPWNHDWGVQFPTQVAYYDEIRIGYNRESVDVSAQQTPVD